MDLRVFGFLGTFILVFTVIGAVIGFLIAGIAGAAIASGIMLVISFIMSFISIFSAEKAVIKKFHAKETDDKKLIEIVESMALNARIPNPKLYVLPIDVPNSFSTGKSKKRSSICITEGILSMNRGEITNIIAHEIFHIVNEDTYIQCVTAVLANMLRWTFVLRPFAVLFTKLSMSDVREYKADYYGTRYSKKPLEMASAIKKMSEVAIRNHMEGSPAFGCIWMVNPYMRRGLSCRYMTHPPTAKRVNRVESMGHEGMPEPFEPIET